MRLLAIWSIWSSLATGQVCSGSQAHFNCMPTGFIIMLLSGTCPTGWSEVAALNGRTLIGTLAANGDVGTTGGSDTMTPAVANPAFTPGGTNSAPTFNGTALAAHSHGPGTLADATSTTGVKLFQPLVVGTAVSAGALSGNTATASAGIPSGTIAAPVFTGSPITLVHSVSSIDN